MKILCVIDSIGSGGAQRQLVELAISFKKMGHNVSFLTYHHAEFYLEVLNKQGIEYTSINEPNYIKRLIKMRSFIRKGDYDSVLSFLEAANFISEIAGFPFRKWRLIVGERSANPNILRSRKLKFYRWMHFFADYIVSNSNENIRMVRQINSLLPARKCKVIYNALDLDKWSPSSDYLPLREGKLKIVVAASHQYVKNLNGLVMGVSGLSISEREKLIIEWYGDKSSDSSFEEAKQLIDKFSLADIFRFYPATLEITAKMQEADVVALFSHHEGLPNAICEGMAIGKPIIATNISDVPLLLSKDNGVLCDSNDITSISNALKKFLEFSASDLSRMGANSRTLAESLFKRDLIVEAYKKLLIDK